MQLVNWNTRDPRRENNGRRTGDERETDGRPTLVSRRRRVRQAAKHESRMRFDAIMNSEACAIFACPPPHLRARSNLLLQVLGAGRVLNTLMSLQYCLP
jgi:hypothetical protein